MSGTEKPCLPPSAERERTCAELTQQLSDLWYSSPPKVGADRADWWDAVAERNDRLLNLYRQLLKVSLPGKLLLLALVDAGAHRAGEAREARKRAREIRSRNAAAAPDTMPAELARILADDRPPGLEHPCPGCAARISIHLLACLSCLCRLPTNLSHLLTGTAGEIASARALSEALDWFRAHAVDPDARLRAGLPVPADGEG